MDEAFNAADFLERYALVETSVWFVPLQVSGTVTSFPHRVYPTLRDALERIRDDRIVGRSETYTYDVDVHVGRGSRFLDQRELISLLALVTKEKE